jgi:hypothetical protein
MNKEIKKLWVEALRSGEYKQARGRLRDEDKFCCLGVLCDLHAKAVGGAWCRDHEGYLVYSDSDALLPPSVTAWAGLSSDSPHTVWHDDDEDRQEEPLAEHNDGRRTFQEIADMIEEQL